MRLWVGKKVQRFLRCLRVLRVSLVVLLQLCWNVVVRFHAAWLHHLCVQKIFMNPKRAIILFDFDGTLIDSTAAIYASFCAALFDNGFALPSQQSVEACIGHTLHDMFAMHGVPPEMRERCVDEYRASYRAHMERGTALLPNAREAVAQASAFAFLGLVTTKRGDYSRVLLQRFGIAEHFACVVGIEDVASPKPAPEPILCALAKIARPEIAPERIFMVGDTALDLQAARVAGVRGLGVLCGFGREGDLRAFDVPLFADALEAVAFACESSAASR